MILSLCWGVFENGKTFRIDDAKRKRILEINKQFGEKALRVIALAYRELPKDFSLDEADKELVFLGLVGMTDPPRPEVSDAIKNVIRQELRYLCLQVIIPLQLKLLHAK